MKISPESESNRNSSFDDDFNLLNQEYDDLLLKHAALEHARRTVQDFDADTSLADIPAPDLHELDRRMQQVFSDAKRKRRFADSAKQCKKILKVAAAFVVVAMASFTALFFSVDAVKINVVNFIVRSHELSTQFHVEDMFGQIPEDAPSLMPEDFREPTYIPAGFEETTSSIHTGYGAIIYESEKTEYVLSYSCMDFNTFLSLDTEDCMVESVSVDGYKAYLYTKYRGDLKGHTSLIWQDGSYIHLISGPITKREIIKMAESLY